MMEKYKHMLISTGGRATKNFTYAELNYSGYAATNRIKNVAVGYAYKNQQWLAIVLQLVREHFNVPMVINSGYRSKEVNDGVDGSKTSAHMHGSAADVSFLDVSKNRASQKLRAYEIGQFLDSIGVMYDQIIYYNTWIHIGMRFNSRPRLQIFGS